MLKSNGIYSNAAWMIGCKVVQSLTSIVIAAYTARFLGPANYGLINYAASIVSFATPITLLGLNSTLVQELVDNPEDEGRILGTSICSSLTTSILAIFGVFVFTSITHQNEQDVILISCLYSILMIFQSVELMQYWFQAKLLSKYASISMLIAYFIVAIYRVFLLITQKGVMWFALSTSIDFLVISILLLAIYKRLHGQRLQFSWSLVNKLISRGKYFIIANLADKICAEVGKLQLMEITGKEATGYYSAAVSCALQTSFIFLAIIDSFRPLILSYRTVRRDYTEQIVRLFSIVFYMALLQSILLTLFAEPITMILYGAQYVNSIPVLRLICWYTIPAYLGGARMVWILAEGKLKYAIWISASIATMNIVLNAILVPLLGVIGAAIAVLISTFLGNLVLPYFIPDMRYSCLLILKGLNPLYLVDLLKNALHRNTIS